MENVTVSSIILTAYTELEDHRYAFFVCIFLTYILIIFLNSVLIFVIFTERGLHGPMYLFICNLGVNAIFGSTCLLPPMLGLLLSHHYEISLTRCQLQIYFLYLYGAVEFTILAVMSYDRYAAICHPLHYHLLMSPKKVYAAIVLLWLIPSVYLALFFIFTVRRSFCGKIIESVYCDNFPLLQLSCSDTTIQFLFTLVSLVLSPGSQIFMILFSYVQILRICLFASKESQMKALQTCTPHLVTVMTFSMGALFGIVSINPQINLSHVSDKARIFMSVYYLIIPQVCNPIVYGMSLQAMRVQIYKIFLAEKSK